jgi:hypothetical protein
VIYENLVDGTPNDNVPDPVITGFDTGGSTYWQSSEYNTSDTWYENFNNGGFSTTGGKWIGRYVRCARR